MSRLLRVAAALALGALITAWTILPLGYALVTSATPSSRLFEAGWWPVAWTGENYAGVFRDQPFALNIFNSLAVALGVTAVSLLLGVTAAYALTRIELRGRGLLLAAVLGVSMFPQVAVLAGMFELIRWLGLYNTRIGLGLSYLSLTLPFTVWLLATFMRDIPRELEEAAVIDGATPWTIVMRIFVPLLAPALVSTGLLAFVAAWNEFLFALTFTLTQETRTVPVAIALMSGASAHELPWGMIMAASVVVSLPVVMLVLVLQRRIVAGLTAGAIRG
jgi:trehalose/maltose transport system permease protein